MLDVKVTDLDSIIANVNSAVTDTAKEVIGKRHKYENPGNKLLTSVMKEDNSRNKKNDPREVGGEKYRTGKCLTDERALFNTWTECYQSFTITSLVEIRQY